MMRPNNRYTNTGSDLSLSRLMWVAC